MQIEDPVQPVVQNLQTIHSLGTSLSRNLHLITTVFFGICIKIFILLQTDLCQLFD